MELYREQILEHWKHPQHWGTLAHATHTAARDNPLCGDRIAVGLIVRAGHVADVRFTGEGCAVSIATMSLLTEQLIGKSAEDIAALGAEHITTLLGATPSPSRMQCALLGLSTTQAALGEKSEHKTTY